MDADALPNCTCFNLRKAARAVTQVYDEALKPSGLRATQFSLLSAVEIEGPVGVAALARMLVMDRTTLTQKSEAVVEPRTLGGRRGCGPPSTPDRVDREGQRGLGSRSAMLAARSSIILPISLDSRAGPECFPISMPPFVSPTTGESLWQKV